MFDMGGGPYRTGELLRPRVGRSMGWNGSSIGALKSRLPAAAAIIAAAAATMDPKNGRFIIGFMV